MATSATSGQCGRDGASLNTLAEEKEIWHVWVSDAVIVRCRPQSNVGSFVALWFWLHYLELLSIHAPTRA
jgi:hypothetical protein